MRRLLPAIVGALAGFAVGFLNSFNFVFLRVDVTGWPAIGLGVCGAILGGLIGAFVQAPDGKPRTVARWSATMAVVVGVISFLIGFAGPIILHPDSPQGPLLGILFTGPLGALAGAVLGAIIGLLVPAARAQR